MWNGPNIASGLGEARITTVQVIPADRNGNVLSQYALGTAQIRINGVTSTTGTGPASIPRYNGTATVTFSNIRDAAGNLVPDGVPIAATVAHNMTITGGWWNGSAGGKITNGALTPNASYKLFTVVNGSITVEYSTEGVTANPPAQTRIQLVPAQRDGTPMGSYTLNGGLWVINLVN